MEIKNPVVDRIRTAAILLSGVIPLVMQPGPLAGEAVASRHVDRLLDELPVSDEELPSEVELQCHLISLVSDVVTLRAARESTDAADRVVPDTGGNDAMSLFSRTPDLHDATTGRRTVLLQVVPESNLQFPEQPRGP